MPSFASLWKKMTGKKSSTKALKPKRIEILKDDDSSSLTPSDPSSSSSTESDVMMGNIDEEERVSSNKLKKKKKSMSTLKVASIAMDQENSSRKNSSIVSEVLFEANDDESTSESESSKNKDVTKLSRESSKAVQRRRDVYKSGSEKDVLSTLEVSITTSTALDKNEQMIEQHDKESESDATKMSKMQNDKRSGINRNEIGQESLDSVPTALETFSPSTEADLSSDDPNPVMPHPQRPKPVYVHVGTSGSQTDDSLDPLDSSSESARLGRLEVLSTLKPPIGSIVINDIDAILRHKSVQRLTATNDIHIKGKNNESIVKQSEKKKVATSRADKSDVFERLQRTKKICEDAKADKADQAFERRRFLEGQMQIRRQYWLRRESRIRKQQKHGKERSHQNEYEQKDHHHHHHYHHHHRKKNEPIFKVLEKGIQREREKKEELKRLEKRRVELLKEKRRLEKQKAKILEMKKKQRAKFKLERIKIEQYKRSISSSGTYYSSSSGYASSVCSSLSS